MAPQKPGAALPAWIASRPRCWRCSAPPRRRSWTRRTRGASSARRSAFSFLLGVRSVARARDRFRKQRRWKSVEFGIFSESPASRGLWGSAAALDFGRVGRFCQRVLGFPRLYHKRREAKWRGLCVRHVDGIPTPKMELGGGDFWRSPFMVPFSLYGEDENPPTPPLEGREDRSANKIYRSDPWREAGDFGGLAAFFASIWLRCVSSFPLFVLKGIDFTTGNIVIFPGDLSKWRFGKVGIIQRVSGGRVVLLVEDPHLLFGGRVVFSPPPPTERS